MSDKQTFLKDKSYGFVPLLSTCERNPSDSHQSYHAKEYTGKLKIKLTVQSPLHVGTNQSYCNENGEIEHLFVRRNGKIVIPGSSVKGIVRGIAEAVSHSCSVKLPDSKLKKLNDALPKGNSEPCDNKKGCLCPTCSIFGMIIKADHDKKRDASAYKSKVTVGEFICTEDVNVDMIDIPSLQAPFKDYPKRGAHDIPEFRNVKGYGNERLYYCQACDGGNCNTCSKQDYYNRAKAAGATRNIEFRGRKFYYTDKPEIKTSEDETPKKDLYEMLLPENVLQGEIIIKNLSQAELELLAYACNLTKRFQLKLGYGKPLGFGKVLVELVDVEDFMGRYSGTATFDKDKVLQMAKEYPEKAPDDIKDAIASLEKIMG